MASLCHGVALKTKRIGREPREQYRSVPRGGVKKKKDRSGTEREVCLFPSIRHIICITR